MLHIAPKEIQTVWFLECEQELTTLINSWNTPFLRIIPQKSILNLIIDLQVYLRILESSGMFQGIILSNSFRDQIMRQNMALMLWNIICQVT